jgi:hypothetical protein
MRRATLAIPLVLSLVPLAPAFGQASSPPIESVDVYGLRTVPEERLREALPFKPGDPAPETPPPTEDLAAALGVARVEVSRVCCGEGGGTLIYVGVEESEGRSPAHLDPPTGGVAPPAEVIAAYDEFTQALIAAVRAGNAQEDRSQGHALSVDPAMRAAQEKFIVFADRHRDLLIEVLRDAANPQHRGVAAQVLGYVSDKPAIVPELTRAVFDSHELVRNNATRALAVMAVYASETPDTGIVIDPAPFVPMLDSLVWSDRNKGLALLSSLTASRDPVLMADLRERSMPSLIEMCGWSLWGHASSSCLILQRVHGLPDNERAGADARRGGGGLGRSRGALTGSSGSTPPA